MTKSRRPDPETPSFARLPGSNAQYRRRSGEDVHPETLAAVVLFQQAAEAEQVTRALLDQVTARLQRAAHAP